MKLNNLLLNKIGLSVLIVISLSFFNSALAHKKHKIKNMKIATTPLTTPITNTNSTLSLNPIVITSKNISNIVPKVIPVISQLTPHIHHPKTKHHLRHTVANNKDRNEESTDNYDIKDNSNNIYFRWGIFVPLVILIFVITVLSIVGFLVLLINSANPNVLPRPEEKDPLLIKAINEVKKTVRDLYLS